MAPSKNGTAPAPRRPAVAESEQIAGSPGENSWRKSIHEAVARETHQGAMSLFGSSRDIWSSRIAKLPGAISNSGVKARGDTSDRGPTRLEVSVGSIAQFPFLIKKIEGAERMGMHTWKYRLRKVNVGKMEDIVKNLSVDVGVSAEAVFGRWALWPSS